MVSKNNQLALDLFDSSAAIKHFSTDYAERGAVFTRREVVDFILDLAGYSIDLPLHKFRLLEPSFGEGDFLLPIAERLLTAYTTQVSDRSDIVNDLSEAIRAVEVFDGSVVCTRAKLLNILQNYGISEENALRILDAWIIPGDFLIVKLPWDFTFAIGNPPYVRQESIPTELIAAYRLKYSTIYDRADLYVPFIERCLSSLEKKGTLAFICSDRWMKNKYGGPLRAMVAGQYHLAQYIDMVDTPAFHSEVIAYPAITIIRRDQPGKTRIAHRPQISKEALSNLSQNMRADTVPEMSGVLEIGGIVNNSDPWILRSFDQLEIVRRLEADFPVLEDAGCRVGIGVATGADKVFIGHYEDLDVEQDRKLPLVGTKDIETGTVQWKGMGVINPFAADGSLVRLADYPKLAAYFEKFKGIIQKRNCAKKNSASWYRTIDRIHPELTSTPKLLIPDIKGRAHIVYETGRFYPHHNLYFITSEEWDLRALCAVLRSGIAKLFVSTYSIQMRGGYLRYQAQYLRRIRIPLWREVPEETRIILVGAAKAGNDEICNQAIYDLYRLSRKERVALGKGGSNGD